MSTSPTPATARAATAREADAQCRGIGARRAPAGDARERREAGAAAERVVPEVKCLVREAASCEAWVDPGDTLMAQVVRWTIEAYDDQPEQAHGPCYL